MMFSTGRQSSVISATGITMERPSYHYLRPSKTSYSGNYSATSYIPSLPTSSINTPHTHVLRQDHVPANSHNYRYSTLSNLNHLSHGNTRTAAAGVLTSGRSASVSSNLSSVESKGRELESSPVLTSHFMNKIGKIDYHRQHSLSSVSNVMPDVAVSHARAFSTTSSTSSRSRSFTQPLSGNSAPKFTSSFLSDGSESSIPKKPNALISPIVNPDEYDRKTSFSSQAAAAAASYASKYAESSNPFSAFNSSNDYHEEKHDISNKTSSARSIIDKFNRSLQEKESKDTLIKSSSIDNSYFETKSSKLDQSTSSNDEMEKDDYIVIPKSSNLSYRWKRSLVGLQNLGNTCFMNSCLQCILSTPPLMEYFLSLKFRNELNRNSPTKGKLAECVAELVKNVCNGTNSDIVSPTEVKRIVSIAAPRFIGYQQQDSQEFLRFLVDGLHDDLNRIRITPKYEQIVDKDNDTMMIRSERWWNNYIARNNSFVVDLFAGQLQSTLVCGVCNHVSIAFDPFWDLSLPIPQSSSSFFGRMLGRDDDVTLEDCFSFFTKPEELTGDNKAYCSKCKTHQKSTKKMEIFRFPEILVVHLKRFNFSKYSRDKITTTVNFPLTSLDISKFKAKESLGHNSSSDRHNYAVYDLFAVSNHSGGMGGGHYIAHAKTSTDNWHTFNDSRVSLVSPSSIGGSSAYVLFYHRHQR